MLYGGPELIAATSEAACLDARAIEKDFSAEAMAPHLGKVPHALTPTTQAICCLRSRLPQRLEHAQGVLRGKLGNRLAADGGE